MAQQQGQQGQQRPTGLDALISMVADLGRKQEAFQRETTTKLDAFRADWDDWREEMPNNYPPRREIDQKITAMERDQADHETRIRQIEAQLPNVRFDAFRETTVTREQALSANTQTQAKVAEERKELDARTIVLLASIPSLLIGLLMLIISLLPHLAYHP